MQDSSEEIWSNVYTWEPTNLICFSQPIASTDFLVIAGYGFGGPGRLREIVKESKVEKCGTLKFTLR